MAELPKHLAHPQDGAPFLAIRKIPHGARARIDSETSEGTLATVWNDDRSVDADCEYGLFKNTDYQGSGMTDDPFG